MGPYLVTADEIPDPQNLKLNLSVNGEIRQDSNLGYMIFKIRDMIAYWSQMELNPGDVLTTGTPPRRRRRKEARSNTLVAQAGRRGRSRSGKHWRAQKPNRCRIKSRPSVLQGDQHAS